MTPFEKQLWERISAFPLDEPGVSLTFSKRLARENGWNLYYTGRVIEEYKKFLLLCCVSAEPVTPSDPVDQAWHLHLTYTKSYWHSLCRDTLCREIHHNPTKGGNAEQQKFSGMYTGLKAVYTQKFGTPPPHDIWQDTTTRFTDINFVRVNLGRYWLISKPGITLKGLTAILAACVLAILFIQASGNAFIIPFIITIFIIVAIYSSKNNNGKGNGNNGSGGCSVSSCSSGSHAHSDADGGSGCSSHGCSSGCSGCGGCGGD